MLFDPPLQAVLRRSGDRFYKLIRHGRREELYEVSSVPGERIDPLGDVDEALVARLRERLDGAIDGGVRQVSEMPDVLGP